MRPTFPRPRRRLPPASARARSNCAATRPRLPRPLVMGAPQPYYNPMGPLSHTQSVADRSFMVRQVTVASPDMLDRACSEQCAEVPVNALSPQVLNMCQQILPFSFSTKATSMNDASQCHGGGNLRGEQAGGQALMQRWARCPVSPGAWGSQARALTSDVAAN